jgi:uncharacterized protein YukE
MSQNIQSLIDRLQKCSEIKYPDRHWSSDFYQSALNAWKDNINELENRVLKLEKELEHVI